MLLFVSFCHLIHCKMESSRTCTRVKIQLHIQVLALSSLFALDRLPAGPQKLFKAHEIVFFFFFFATWQSKRVTDCCTCVGSFSRSLFLFPLSFRTTRKRAGTETKKSRKYAGSRYERNVHSQWKAKRKD